MVHFIRELIAVLAQSPFLIIYNILIIHLYKNIFIHHVLL